MIYPLPYFLLSEVPGPEDIDSGASFYEIKIDFFLWKSFFLFLLQKQVWNWQEAVWTENKRIILMNCHIATFIMSR